MTANGSGICDVAAIEARQPGLAQKFNSSTTVEYLTSIRHFAKPLLAVVRYFICSMFLMLFS